MTRGESSPEQTGTPNLLAEQNLRLDGEVKAALAEKIEKISDLPLPELDSYFNVALTKDIKSAIAGLGYDAQLIHLGPPTKKNILTEGVDLALNTVQIARQANSSPLEVSAHIAASLQDHPMIATVETAGPYVNIELKGPEYALAVLQEVSELGQYYGHSREGDPEVIIIDYSSPNVAKSMTVAHLRSTVIGHSLMKIHQAAGNIPFGINHIGDWGTQFGNIIYQYKKEMAEQPEELIQEIQQNPNAAVMRLYRTFTANKEDSPESVETGRKLFLDLEQGDPEMVELWAKFREWSLQEFGPVYASLGVDFDAIQGESFYEDKMTPAVEDALDKGVLRRNEEGAIVFPSQPIIDPTTGQANEGIMLNQAGEPRDEIIVKSTGGTVYLTRDLAGIRYRTQELGASRIIYVIGKEQKNHCLELFAMADQMDYAPLGSAEHVSFGHLNIEGSKMKSRKGEVILLEDIIGEAINAAAEVMVVRKQQRGEDSSLTEEELDIARKIAIGTIIFNDLRNHREKDIEFDRSAVKSLEAGNAVYVQYANARLNAVLEKVGSPEPITVMPEMNASEKSLLIDISRFPVVVKEAAERNTPHVILGYLNDLCQSINLFYHNYPIANADSPEKRNLRLNIVATTKQVIVNAADFIHLELPEKM